MRPEVEEDLFYNGWNTGGDASLKFGNQIAYKISDTSSIHTGAFMTNFLLKFAFKNFQPYLGAGIGVYIADSASQSNLSNGLSWQLIGGADYYFNLRISTFLEYKYLTYEDPNHCLIYSHYYIGQQLIGAGIRFHF